MSDSSDSSSSYSDAYESSLPEGLLPIDRFIHKSGFVDYDEVLRNPDIIEHNLALIRSADIRGYDRRELLAFHTNAYNITCLSAVAAKLKGDPLWSGNTSKFRRYMFFMSAKYTIAGVKNDLHAYENKVIRPSCGFSPSVHVLLNCGSIGCPRLQPRLLSRDNVDEVVAQLAQRWVDDHGAAIIVRSDSSGAVVRLSEIFKWYASDFEGSGGWLRFVRKYSRNAKWGDIDAKTAKVEWTPYDWRVHSITKAVEVGILERGEIRRSRN